jgi:hypothetical protein
MSHQVSITDQFRLKVSSKKSAELPTNCVPHTHIPIIAGSLEPLILEETWYFSEPENKN